MQFLDANIFVYAFVNPKRNLDAATIAAKKKAAAILQSQREFCTSVVHVSEVANVIESISGQEQSTKIISALLSTPNIKVLSVSAQDYLTASQVSLQAKVGANDALAYVLMKSNGVSEMLSFDRAFDKLPGIKRLEE